MKPPAWSLVVTHTATWWCNVHTQRPISRQINFDSYSLHGGGTYRLLLSKEDNADCRKRSNTRGPSVPQMNCGRDMTESDKRPNDCLHCRCEGKKRWSRSLLASQIRLWGKKAVNDGWASCKPLKKGQINQVFPHIHKHTQAVNKRRGGHFTIELLGQQRWTARTVSNVIQLNRKKRKK